jgi:hypothetical protein
MPNSPGVRNIYFSSICKAAGAPGVIIRDSRAKTGIETSQKRVTGVTARRVGQIQNAGWEGCMPILIVALIALAAFGLIGVMLALAVTLEQKKSNGKSGAGKVA